jgi:hypothetical protein
MPKIKVNEYGEIVRNYLVHCPNCNEYIRVTGDTYECQHCGTYICPDCLTILSTTYKTIGLDGGFTISCVHCGYEVASA